MIKTMILQMWKVYLFMESSLWKHGHENWEWRQKGKEKEV